MPSLSNKVAWITGAGSGMGEAAAVALAGAGATVVLTGRTKEALERVAERIRKAGGKAYVQPGDVAKPETAKVVVDFIERELGRLDILFNNAGMNIPDRSLQKLTPARVDEMIHTNLSGAFYGVLAALPIMRRQKDGLIINTSSNAGRYISAQPGSSYTAAKHGVVALSHCINTEECKNGIRATAFLPHEVATPILENRPVKVTPEERARMVQPEDVGDLIRYIAALPPHVCMNEVHFSPTWNTGYVSALGK